MHPDKKRRRSSSESSRKKQHTEGSEKTPAPVATKDVDAGFAEIVRGIGVTLETPTPTTPSDVPPPPQPARPKPNNPWAGKVKKIPKAWGATAHESMHFAPTTTKSYHGVWGTNDRKTVRAWVSLARDSINADDD